MTDVNVCAPSPQRLGLEGGARRWQIRRIADSRRVACPSVTPLDSLIAIRRYYGRWSSMTIENIGPEMSELLQTLAQYCPPATVVDKHIYSS